MANDQTQAIIALFATETGAGDALKTLKDTTMDGRPIVDHAAVLRADAGGKLHIAETADMSGKKGAVIGGVAGGIVGLLGAAVVPPLAIGAVIGGLAARLRDSGFPNARLEELSAQVKPGQSILVVAVADGAAAAERALREAGATVVCEAVDGQLAAALDADATVPAGA